MPAHRPHPRSRSARRGGRKPIAYLRRIAAALAMVICGLLALAAAVPAASAAILSRTRIGQAASPSCPQSRHRPAAWSPPAAWQAGRSR